MRSATGPLIAHKSIDANEDEPHPAQMNYDFGNLSPSEFEDLARDLIGRELGVRFEAFPEGPDDGMDGRHVAAEGAIILQAKHYKRSGFTALKSTMAKERATVDRLAPKRYILATSAALTPKNKAALETVVGPAILGPGDIFGPDDLNSLLRKYPEIEQAHQKLWATSSAVFEAIVTGIVGRALGKSLSAPSAPAHLLAAPKIVTEHARQAVKSKIASAYLALKFDPSIYVKRSLEDDISDWLATPRSKASPCFLVLAPAGSGKTNLLCRIADASSLKRPTALLVGGQLRIDGNVGLWTSVFESFGLPRLPQHSRTDRVAIATQMTKVANGCAVIIDAINEHPDPIGLKHELSAFLAECEAAGIHALVSCRDYYWGLFDASWWSAFLRTHRDERKSTRRTLGNFTPEEGADAFRRYFEHYNVSAQPQGNALEQFRHPLLLRFFCETYRGETLGRLRDIRLKDLFDTYWDRKLASIAERMIDQGMIAVLPDLTRHIGRCILDISDHMLSNNVRAIPVLAAQRLMQSESLPSQLPAPYGRIIDEHIVLEEFDAWGTTETTKVAFVFEEFMEYAMARSRLVKWHSSSIDEIYVDVVSITDRYDEFSQVLGAVLYLALMLKEQRDIALWSALINRGAHWEKVIIEAFKRLPEDQIDDGVFEALIDLLHAPHPSTRIEALELLKFGRLRRIPTPSLIEAVGDLVTSDDLRVRRRALLALGSCPAAFAIPLIEKAITTPIPRKTHAYEVVRNAATALAKLDVPDCLHVIALIFGGYWHAGHISQIVFSYVHKNVSRVHALLYADDIILRLGAIRLLKVASSPDAIARLEKLIAEKRAQPRTWAFNDLPQWVKVSGPFSLSLLSFCDVDSMDWADHPEIMAAETVIREIETQLGGNARYRTLHRLTDELVSDPDHSRLRNAIPTLDYDKGAVIKILQAGLERRDPKKWRVKRSRRGISIRPRARSANLTLARSELAVLLNLEERDLDRHGVDIGTSSWEHDYWKEYIYRCWGWEPAIKGYFDSD